MLTIFTQSISGFLLTRNFHVLNFDSFQFVLKGTVFARMLPDLKVQLIEELQNIG